MFDEQLDTNEGRQRPRDLAATLARQESTAGDIFWNRKERAGREAAWQEEEAGVVHIFTYVATYSTDDALRSQAKSMASGPKKPLNTIAPNQKQSSRQFNQTFVPWSIITGTLSDV
eukprot:SAG11_NODE_1365_length_5109_cov_2.411976_2_plen_116_part_00